MSEEENIIEYNFLYTMCWIRKMRKKGRMTEESEIERRGNENCRMAYKKCINFIANAEQKSSEDFVLTLRVVRVHSEALRHQSSLLWGHSHHLLSGCWAPPVALKKVPTPQLRSSDIEWPWKGEKKIFFIVIFFSPINWMSPAPSSARCRLVLALLLLLFYYGFSTTHPHRRNIHSFISSVPTPRLPAMASL